jgi:hypothetical protein
MAEKGNGATAVNGVVSVQTIISLAAVLIMAFGGGWAIFQSQFSNMQKQLDDVKQVASVIISRNEFDQFQSRFDSLTGEVTRLQQEQHAVALSAARHPIEKETLDVIDADFSKRIDQIEVQIQDINRQIAAALIIIDQQKSPLRSALPPEK